MIKVFMGIPSNTNVIDSQAYILRDIERIYKDKVTLVYPDQCVRRMFHDFARNKIVEDFLASDCDVLWFLDSDITPPTQVMDLVALDYDKWSLAGCTYPVWMVPPGGDSMEVTYTAYIRQPETGIFHLTDVPLTGEGVLDGLATGCLFIKREVLEKLSAPYFEFKYDSKKDMNIIEGEDIGFCRKVSDLGYKFYTDYDLRCKHQKSVCLLDVNNYAISYAQRTIDHFQNLFKEEAGAAMKAAYASGFAAGQKSSPKAQKPASSQTLWLP